MALPGPEIMSDKFDLWVDAHTPVGPFRGTINKVAGSEAELAQTRDAIQKQIDRLEFIVLYVNDGSEITLPGTLVKNSVLTFSIINS